MLRQINEKHIVDPGTSRNSVSSHVLFKIAAEDKHVVGNLIIDIQPSLFGTHDEVTIRATVKDN